jgi:vesicle coat complex subunit
MSYKDTTFKVVKSKWLSFITGQEIDEPDNEKACPLFTFKDSNNSYWKFLYPKSEQSMYFQTIWKAPRWWYDIIAQARKASKKLSLKQVAGWREEYDNYFEYLQNKVFPNLVDNWKIKQQLSTSTLKTFNELIDEL